MLVRFFGFAFAVRRLGGSTTASLTRSNRWTLRVSSSHFGMSPLYRISRGHACFYRFNQYR